MNRIAIYIVDNYLLARLTLKRYFCMFDEFDVIGDFTTLDFCFEKMRTKQADVIILNLDILEKDEIDKIKQLKQEFPAVKVIVKTFQRNKEKILQTLCAGVSGYITDENTDLKKIVEIAFRGNFLMDSRTAMHIFSALSEFNSTEFEALNENKKLKNSLTRREMEVLKLITEGKTNSQIAEEIIISTNTAKAHVGSILTKMSVTDRVQAAVKAVKARLF